MESLFTPLKKNGLTTLKIRYDWKKEQFRFFAAKEWESNFEFSQYNKTFYAEGVYTDQAVYFNTKQVAEMFADCNLTDYLERVCALIQQGRHAGMECYFNEKHNIRFMCNQHSLKPGINNKSHATMAGGIRRHGLDEAEIDVIIDGLNLGRAMSFKNVAADLPFGGCKTTVHMDALDMDNLEVMGFLAFALDRTRCLTAPDMNFPTAMSDVMTKHFSVQFAGGPQSPLGETGKPTAYGTYLGLKQAVKFLTGTESLNGLSVALQGLGSIGWYMAEHLCAENAILFVTDVDKARVDRLIAKYPDQRITYVTPAEILTIQADILCPCAIGGIIHEENIPNLKFKIIFGAANNQLRASSQEEEIRLARLLMERGILYQTEWWHNIAGVLCSIEEYYFGEMATYKNLEQKIEAIIPLKTHECLTRSQQLGISPCEYVYKACEQVLYK